MDHLNFNSEERQLLQRIAAAGNARYVFSYASLLFAPIVFAIYGFVKHDPSAIIAAFLGLLVIFLWVISYNTRNAKLLSSICARLLTADERDAERK